MSGIDFIAPIQRGIREHGQWMLKQEERGYKPDLTEVVLIAEKNKDYYENT